MGASPRLLGFVLRGSLRRVLLLHRVESSGDAVDEVRGVKAIFPIVECVKLARKAELDSPGGVEQQEACGSFLNQSANLGGQYKSLFPTERALVLKPEGNGARRAEGVCDFR
jgi:hypothetical protein